MGYYCNKCREDIPNEVFEYSMEHFKIPLCLVCQKKVGMGSRRKEPRKPEPTPQQKKLAEYLKKFEWKVELEKWDGYKHIDIAIVDAKVNIEVDGPQHNADPKQALADLKRTFYSFKKGYVTLRIPNCLTQNEKTIKETADYIHEFLEESKIQLDDEEYVEYD